MAFLIYLPPVALATGLGVLSGALTRIPGWLRVITPLACTCIVVALILRAGAGDGVTVSRYWIGILIAAGATAAPICVYAAIGRALRRHPLVLCIVWAVSLVPVVYYGILALLVVLDFTSCSVDAYECPV